MGKANSKAMISLGACMLLLLALAALWLRLKPGKPSQEEGGGTGAVEAVESVEAVEKEVPKYYIDTDMDRVRKTIAWVYKVNDPDYTIPDEEALDYDEWKRQLAEQWRDCYDKERQISEKNVSEKGYNWNYYHEKWRVECMFPFRQNLVNATIRYPYDAYLYGFVVAECQRGQACVPEMWWRDKVMIYRKLMAFAMFPEEENDAIYALLCDFSWVRTIEINTGNHNCYAGLELSQRSDLDADFYKSLMDNDKLTFEQARKMLCYLTDRLDMEKLDERQKNWIGKVIRNGFTNYRGRLSAEETAEMEAAWRRTARRAMQMTSFAEEHHRIEIADYAEAAEEEARRIELLRQERAARMPGVKASREDLDLFLESISGEERRWTVPMLKDALDKFRLYSAMLRTSPDLPDYVRMGDEVYKDRRELEILNICYRLGVTNGREAAARAIEAIKRWDGDERLVWLRLQCVDARNLSRKDARLVRRLGPALLGFDPGNPEYRSWGEMAKKL